MKSLFIIGATKSGTTSLFKYLAEHKEISSSLHKEIRYFLNKDFPAKTTFGNYDSKSIEEYLKLFPKSRYFLDASPDYIHDLSSAEKIYENFPDAKIILILRDPVERIYSWYRFELQNGEIGDISFEEYLEIDKNSKFSRVEQGLYSKYILKYLEYFPKENFLTIFTKDLKEKPENTLQEICSFLEIENIYLNYNFKIHNKTETMRSPKLHLLFRNIKRFIRKNFRNMAGYEKIRDFINREYEKINVKDERKIPISNKTYLELQKYYSDEKLERVIGKKPAWKK
jgi:hypothetical protein